MASYESLTAKGIVEPLIQSTLLALEHLMDSNPFAFYELVMWCRDRDHVLFGNTREILSSKGLLHDAVRDVVLIAVTGDGFNMTLDRP